MFASILVTVENVEAARSAAAAIEGGDGMFSTPCYTAGVLSHYISSGDVSDEILAAVQSLAIVSHEDPHVMLSNMGLKLTGDDMPQEVAE
jgi:hypothetical protein